MEMINKVIAASLAVVLLVGWLVLRSTAFQEPCPVCGRTDRHTHAFQVDVMEGR